MEDGQKHTGLRDGAHCGTGGHNNGIMRAVLLLQLCQGPHGLLPERRRATLLLCKLLTRFPQRSAGSSTRRSRRLII